MEELNSVRETAERLGVTRQYILYLIGHGRIPARKVGKQWVLPATAKIEPTRQGRPLKTLEIPRSKGGKR